MADWKAQITYNYNPSYQAYAYSFMYQPGTEQNHANVSPWAESGLGDLGNYPSSSASQASYPPAAAPWRPEQCPLENPEPQQVYSGQGHYQSPGLVYLGDTEASRLRLSRQQQETERGRVGSESASDSEPRTSPDSWSCGSSGEGCPPQADPATWAHKTDLDETTISISPNATEDLPIKEEPQAYCTISRESINNTPGSLIAPSNAPKNPGTTKGKVRSAFSESQMNTLAQRFNVQRYLTPAEMKNMAELTGLTYKQVKTWFQNRRMKLRRHQKDNSWASERYTINKDNTGHSAVFTNFSSHIQPYQGEARPVLKEHYNQHVIEAALKTTAPPNLAFYYTSMGGSAGYPAWSSGAHQSGVQTWPLPSEVSHFDYNAFNPPSVATGPDVGFKDGEQINIRASSHSTVIVQSAAQ